ncbi:RIO1 family-domain-containing protein [Tirmania nivea]|nr:RIO1 family-domain-containing protein [Tirmania nivea]
MKLNTAHVRYLSPDDWRVLTAVELGSKNHEVVPTPLISHLSSLHGSISRSISTLAKAGLIAKVKNTTYDGYRLTYGGLDYLSLHSLIKKNMVFSISQTPLGVGKESDVYVVATPPNLHLTQAVLKIHRLGRISFRSVKRSRDYLDNNRIFKSSWQQLSRLSAAREASFMTALYNHNFPVPKLISQNRHTLLMTLHRAPPLRNLQNCPDIPGLWARLMELLVRLGQHGLVHGDFNEFNLLCYEGTTEVVVIDFPQMVSVDHPNAREMWERDLEGLKRWFQRRWGWVVDEKTLPRWEKDVLKVIRMRGPARLDALVDATGFSKKQLKELEKAIRDQRGEDGEGANAGDEDEDEEEDEEEEEEEEGEVVAGQSAEDDATEAMKLLDITKDKIEFVPL